MKLQETVNQLVVYGIRNGLIAEEDAVYTANSLFAVLGAEPSDTFHPSWNPEDLIAGKEEDEADTLQSLLAVLLDEAASAGLIDGGIASRDLLDTKLMGCLTARPSEVIREFHARYEASPEAATDYFYKLAKDSDYIRRYRICKDRKWVAPTEYGDLDITINLSKPEKDPRAIAAALTRRQDSYPRCLLCPENEGYAGRLDHPARQTIRLIPLSLEGEKWYLQYSPYVYYNEHCIVLSEEHRPMKIERATFARLLEFVRIFPHYTVGSNADLPIVGGSILTHEHFQGGRYTFAMAKAPVSEKLTFAGYEDIEAGIVKWPMSVIRLDGTEPRRIVELADRILTAWRGYSDPEAEVLSETEGTPHNTITPIARMREGRYELDLVLRNNRTTDKYPLGIFHPHQELHHIKKENIGLIEVMGLAVLPARLLPEMETLRAVLLEGGDPEADPSTASHAAWAEELKKKYGKSLSSENVDRIIRDEIGIVFMKVLKDCGVFKDSEAGRAQFRRFAASLS